MKGWLSAELCLGLIVLGTIACSKPQVQTKDPPIVQGATQAASGLWEAKLKIGPSTFEMVQVPPGTFQMGTNATGIGWIEKNGIRPVHSVMITHPFLMQKHPVTVAQFKVFVEETGYKTEAEQGGGTKIYLGKDKWEYREKVNWRNPSYEHELYDGFDWVYRDDLSRLDAYLTQVDSCPVVCVSWNDAQAFIRWLNAKGGPVAFRLPTEAEYEYACRAGTTGETYGPLDDVAWYVDNGLGYTHPVAQKQPNAFGLYDMLGNVWQWCEDKYGKDYYANSPSQDPQGAGDGVKPLQRGSSWMNGKRTARAAARDWDDSTFRRTDLGFRLVAVARTQ